jgi:hypothetical protein
MLAAVKDVSKLLVGIPKGAWVALSKDEEHVLAYAAELLDVLKKANESGEKDPIIIRIPESDSSTLIL